MPLLALPENALLNISKHLNSTDLRSFQAANPHLFNVLSAPEQPVPRGHLLSLPNELILDISKHLTTYPLNSLRQTCKRLHVCLQHTLHRRAFSHRIQPTPLGPKIFPALVFAASFNRHACLHYLLRHRQDPEYGHLVNINAQGPLSILRLSNRRMIAWTGSPPLLTAVHRGQAEIVGALLEAGADVAAWGCMAWGMARRIRDLPEEKGRAALTHRYTPVHVAVLRRRPDVVAQFAKCERARFDRGVRKCGLCSKVLDRIWESVAVKGKGIAGVPWDGKEGIRFGEVVEEWVE